MQTLCDTVAQALRVPGDAMRDVLLAVPLPIARFLFLAIPAMLLLWALLMDPSRLRGQFSEHGRTVNLRPYILIALAIQIAIYTLL